MHEQRKSEHLRIALEESVSPGRLSTGFEQYRFRHVALPEVNLEDVTTRVTFLGHTLSSPLLISSMTGGTPLAGTMNQRLALVAQEFGIALALGSARAAIENEDLARSFQVRQWAPDVCVLCNLGAVQLNYGYGIDQCMRAVEMAGANALVLHLNPLQEALQKGGNTRFYGLLSQIKALVARIPVPIVVKEVGWGISGEIARGLVDCGVSAIDVAGAGGTSWSAVESHRAPNESLQRLAADFDSWGIPTTECIREARRACPNIPLIGSGGIRSGVDLAKAIALGADIGGVGLPFLKAAAESHDSLTDEVRRFIDGLHLAMFCIGARDVQSLRTTSCLTRV